MRRRWILTGLAVALSGSLSWVAAQQNSNAPKPNDILATTASPSGATGTTSSAKPAETTGTKEAAPVRNEPAAERIEGEKRFRTNCGRCHQSPHKFPPREMATIIRHMRVRATITDEDMRLILKYMTE
jgi:mono/diheme cytochrome c family protein